MEVNFVKLKSKIGSTLLFLFSMILMTVVFISFMANYQDYAFQNKYTYHPYMYFIPGFTIYLILFITGLILIGSLDKRYRILRILSALIAVCIMVSIYWHYFKPYDFEKWQIETNNSDWKLSYKASSGVSDYNCRLNNYALFTISDFLICLPNLDLELLNHDRYREAFIKKAVNAGMKKSELDELLSIADKQGPQNKFPIYMETALRDNVPVFVVIYECYPCQWLVVIDRHNKMIIQSEGTV